jgi:hypothetical protein
MGMGTGTGTGIGKEELHRESPHFRSLLLFPLSSYYGMNGKVVDGSIDFLEQLGEDAVNEVHAN